MSALLKCKLVGTAAAANIWFDTDYLWKEGLLLLATQEMNITHINQDVQVFV